MFRALATMEGTLTQLAPGFDIVAEARRFGGKQLAAQLSPEAIRKTATDELAALVPLLRGCRGGSTGSAARWRTAG